MYLLLAILFGLVVLFVLLLYQLPIRLPPVRGVFYERAAFAHRCAIANFQILLKEFNAGIRRRDGESVVIIYPELVREYVADSRFPRFHV